ncbi:MAG: deoxyribose-phosphate aldolase [Bacteroidetes bacterium HGW-Bacteroidetes-8]|jgi:deoxyribose-phosphate aldolase|nr:MAG: deoxyribose-phosphate aldolase [Bacteroidetes bacterium HGW-Bacteroidetes-8]
MKSTPELLEGIEKKIKSWDKKEVLSACFGFIDLTSLNTTDTEAKIISMTERVNQFRGAFPNYGQVAAMCVFPNFAKTVRANLTDKDVNLAVVAGVFPSSQSFYKVKALECRMAVEDGANEVDIVLALNYFLSGEYNRASDEISLLKEAVKGAHLKVILETGALKDDELIYNASMLAMKAGADFIKTSTGKLEPAATPQAALVMCKAIKEFHKSTGKKVGFKPAGGIVTPSDAIKYYAIVDTILGSEWLNSNLFRLGASRLANNLLSQMESKEINYF